MTCIRRRIRPVWHQTEIVYDGRPLLVAETPHAVLLRRKGTRLTLSVPWAIAYLKGASIKAQLNALEKQNRKRRQRAESGVSRGRINFN